MTGSRKNAGQQLFFVVVALKDTRVWIPDQDRVWKAVRLAENYEPSAKILRLIAEDEQIVSSPFFDLDP